MFEGNSGAHSPLSVRGKRSKVVRELASGIDALYLSGRGEVEQELLEDLDRVRETARAESDHVPFRLGRVEFGLAPYGWGKYPFRLSHEYGLIGITGSQKLPAIRVQPRAEMLHGVGPEATVDTFSDILSEVGEVQWAASRVDLFTDVQGWWPTVEERDRFVTRARTRDTFEESEELNGFRFGRGGRGGLMARVYDKSRESDRKGTTWWRDKWGDAYLPGEPVARVEFQFGRTVLRQFTVDSPDDVFEKKAGLWGYATKQWLSYRSPSGDTRSRWPIAEEWEAIQSVSLRDRPVTLERTYRQRSMATEAAIRPALCGYISALAAIRNVHSIDGILPGVASMLRVWESETGIPFSERVSRKQRNREWGL